MSDPFLKPNPNGGKDIFSGVTMEEGTLSSMGFDPEKVNRLNESFDDFKKDEKDGRRKDRDN
jgi:hypothetical protein